MRLKIKSPFWSAWRRYGWSQNDPGIGINERDVITSIGSGQNIEITVGDNPETYSISGEEIKTYCMLKASIFEAKNNVRLFVMPLSYLKRNIIK